MKKLNDIKRISEYKADNIEIQKFFKSKKKLYNPVLINTEINNKSNENNLKGLDLKKLRIKMSLTQEKLAVLLGIDKDFIYSFENNINIPISEKIIINSFFETKKFKEKPFEPDLFNIEQQIEVKQKLIVMNGLDIISIREEFKMTQQSFAELLGINRKTVMNWEKGMLVPKSKVLHIDLLVDRWRRENSGFEKNVEPLETFNSKIEALNDHIKTLKDLIEEKTVISDMHKSENLKIKEEIELLKSR